MYLFPTLSRERVARAALLGIMLVVLITLLLFIVHGPSRRMPAASVSILPQSPDAGLREFSFVESRGGMVDWTIHAKQAQVFDADAKAELTGVHVTLSDAEGVQMTAEGDEGTINTASKDFMLRQRAGDLALVFQDGYTIYTRRVSWVNNERRFWTDAHVKIVGPSLEVTGEGMDALMTTHEMRIRQNARVEVH